MLSEDLLTLLRQWWKVGRQQGVMHRDGPFDKLGLFKGEGSPDG